MPKVLRNVGASVRARLQNLSRETGQSFELILTRYALERLLYRLSTSVYADRFVLKGAMLLTSWFTDPHRATRDLDLLGFGDPRMADALLKWPWLSNFSENPRDDRVMFSAFSWGSG